MKTNGNQIPLPFLQNSFLCIPCEFTDGAHTFYGALNAVPIKT